MNTKIQPPKISSWIIRRLSHSYHRQSALGDIEEMYNELCEDQGKRIAAAWYRKYVFKSIPRLMMNLFKWSFAMLNNYFKIAFRNILRRKMDMAINTSGLAIGMAGFLLITIYVMNEFSYDNYHNDSDRIYRVVFNSESESSSYQSAIASAPLIPVLKDNYPEIEAAGRVLNPWWETVVRKDEIVSVEREVLWADNEIMDIFEFNFIRGDAETPLSRPGTVIITERIAEKYFGNTDPVGQNLISLNRNWEITGVVSNHPENSHMKYGLIFTLTGVEKTWDLSNWGWTLFHSYIKLQPNVDADAFGLKIRNIADNYIKEKLVEWKSEYIYILQPVKDIHLYSNLSGEMDAPGNVNNIYIFGAVGILLLITACINYMNHVTARYMGRAKEIGMRKVVGAKRNNIVKQFMIESFIMTVFASVFSVSLVRLFLPLFNELSGRNFEYGHFTTPAMAAIMFGVILFVTLSAGSYPSFFLSLLRPITVLKGSMEAGVKGGSFRNILVVGQFSVTIVFLISTFVIYNQIEFMKNKDLGFDKDQKLVIDVDFNNNYEGVKEEFLKHPGISGATASWSVPGRIADRYTTRLTDQQDNKQQAMLYHYFDHDFTKDFDIKILAGRTFNKEISTDILESFLINEAAVKAFGWNTPDEAIGRRIYEGGQGGTGKIIGVTEDFHISGLQNIVEPLIIQIRPDRFEMMTLTISPENLSATMDFIEDKWKEMNLGSYYRYFFLDEDFNNQYGAEERTGKLFILFACIAVFISCLGFFSLTSYVVSKRTKEIGIRKVLGASESLIFFKLSKEFTRWVILANVIAWPTAWYLMKKWLENFAYQTELNLLLFIIPGIAALIIALLTISSETIKAARANPAASLKYE